ncbi:MAG: NAD+ synthase [Rhabdochlamydiaceae bacterium]|jgi:NAD+ synthase (glutamine-hydrolysing)
MKVFVCQLDLTIGDYKGNLKKILDSIEKGRKERADIILFSELTLCAYPPEDLLLHENFVLRGEETLEKILPHTKGLMVVVGLVRRNLAKGEKSLLNSAAILQDGKIVGFQDKALLPTYDVFDERRYFEPGTQFNTWQWKGKKVGVLICEDIWEHANRVGFTKYSCDPVSELAKQNIDLLLNLSASPYQFQKSATRVKVCQAVSKTLQKPVILCAQVGGNDQLVFDGYSVAIGADGELRQLAKGFEEDWMMVDLDAPACPCPFEYDSVGDLYKALVLGTRDYFHKQGFSKGIVGLSGGIDSALVACIAVDALGKENVLGASLPSKYNAPSSTTDAEKLAKNLGIKWDIIPIQSMFEECLKDLTPHFNGKAPDVTEENIQSRLRGLTLMALSNKLGALVLSTGNKSELAMGYCTLYGDMAGGLSVIADVNKTQVYMLSRWLNRKKEIIPQAIIDKPPSAELRPNQRDTDTLPEYSTVDAVVQSYVEDLMTPEEIIEVHHLPEKIVHDLIRRIHLAEFKRRQAAPGIRVTKKSFRVGRRYPIVQKWV